MDNRLRLFPQGTTITPDGQLKLRDYRVVDLVAQYGTPLYVYDVGTIQQQIEAYQQGLATYAGQSRLTYACKAYLNTALAHLMSQIGLGLDVSSPGEIFVARHGGANPALMHLHGNNKSVSDLKTALRHNVGRIVVDNATELHQLIELVREHKRPVKIWLRINPDLAIRTHHGYTATGSATSKFGLLLVEAEKIAHSLLKYSTGLELCGFHVHVGSHFTDATLLYQAVEKLLDLAVKLQQQYDWQLRELCPGGGWAVPYHPDDPPMPITPFVTELVTQIEVGCQARQLSFPKLILEPGRSLIAPAGVALYTIGGRKTRGKPYPQLSVDGGLADNIRTAMYQANYTALLANWANSPYQETVQIVGSYCESGDMLIEQVELPPAIVGDILAIPVAGAYHLSMSSNYNAALRPAVLFIDQGEVLLVQRREVLLDLTRRDINPYH